MTRILAVLLVILLPQPLFAQCKGRDLLADLPEAEVAALRVAAARQPFHQGLLWRAERGGQVVHLFGTLHIYAPRHENLIDQIEPLIARAETVFLEIAPGDDKLLQAKIADTPGIAFIVDGPTLPELLSEQEWRQLRRIMAERGVPGFLAAKMRPWMAISTLAVARCALEDIQNGRFGLDQMVMARATELGKTPVALEPFDTLFTIFDSFTEAEQLDFLRLGIAQQVEDADAQMVTLVESYYRGEARLVWEWSFAQAQAVAGLPDDIWRKQTARTEEALVNRRNRNWMKRILPAAEKGEVLVAVGALHLPGNQGLLSLLQDQGFTITRVPRAD